MTRKNHRWNLTILLVLLAFLWAGCGRSLLQGTDETLQGERGASWPQEKSALAPDPAVRFGRLSNGFRYVLMENREPKDRVSMQLNVQAGSLYETEEQRGLAHFLEHMLFNGSDHFGPGELVKYFQSIGMQFGPDANAHTGFDETVYDILLPNGTPESLAQGLLVMRDWADGALLLESEIERERGVVLSEMQTRDSAAYRTFVTGFRFEMSDSRVARRLPIGEERTLRSAGRKLVKEFYDTWYRPERSILVAVGDFDAEIAERLIRERFSPMSARAPARPEPSVGRIDHKGVLPFYHHEAEEGSTTVGIEVFSVAPAENDSEALQHEEILREAAGRIVQNRLDRRLREPGAPFTSAHISSGRFLQRILYAEISAQGSPGNWKGTLQVLEQTLRQALDYGFTESELERVRQDMLAELDSAIQKAPTRDSQDLSGQIIRHLNNNRVFMSPTQEKGLFAPFLAAMTADTLHEALKRTWSPDHRLVLVTGNVELGDGARTGADKVREAFERSRKVFVDRPKEEVRVGFPYLPLPSEAGPAPRIREIEDLQIRQVDFPNGVRLNFKRTDFKANEIGIHASFGRGRSSEPADRSGLADVSQGVVNESGFGRLTRDQLDRALAGKNTRMEFAVDEDRFLIRIRTQPDEIELAFQLLHSALVDPGYREDALRLTIGRLKEEYLKQSSAVEGQMDLVGRRFLAGGDSRFGQATPQELDRLSLEAVRQWIGDGIGKGPLEVSVVGDAEADRVQSLVSRYLGSLSRLQEKGQDPSRNPVFPAGQEFSVRVSTQISKSMVVVAWPTEDFWDIGRTRRLLVLGSLFSERLRERVREKLGASYSPYAYSEPSRAYRGYGLFQAVVQTDPAVSGRVRKEILEIAKELTEKPVPGDEFKRVMEPILTSLKDLRRSNEYWLRSVMTGSVRHPEQIQWARSLVDDFGSIRSEDLLKAARTYLDTRKAAFVIVVPEEGDSKQ